MERSGQRAANAVAGRAASADHCGKPAAAALGRIAKRFRGCCVDRYHVRRKVNFRYERIASSINIAMTNQDLILILCACSLHHTHQYHHPCNARRRRYSGTGRGKLLLNQWLPPASRRRGSRTASAECTPQVGAAALSWPGTERMLCWKFQAESCTDSHWNTHGTKGAAARQISGWRKLKSSRSPGHSADYVHM